MLDDKRIDEIRGRCEMATPGPWTEIGNSFDPTRLLINADLHRLILSILPPVDRFIRFNSDMAFLAGARQDIPDLLADRDELLAKLKTMEKSRRRAAGRRKT